MRRKRITITIKNELLNKLDTIIDGQKIKNRSNAIETIISKEFRHYTLAKAVLLGGDLTLKVKGKTIPKLLTPFEGSTILEKNIEILQSFGVEEVIIESERYKDTIKEYIKDKISDNIKISFVSSKNNACLLRKVRNSLDGTFLAMNSDIYLKDIDIEDIYNFHRKNKSAITMLVATIAESTQLGSVYMKGDTVTSFAEKLSDKVKQSHLVNGGVYIMEPDVVNLISQNSNILEKDLFPKISKKGKLFGYQIGKNWVHLHDFSDYKSYLKNKTQ